VTHAACSHVGFDKGPGRDRASRVSKRSPAAPNGVHNIRKQGGGGQRKARESLRAKKIGRSQQLREVILSDPIFYLQRSQGSSNFDRKGVWGRNAGLLRKKHRRAAGGRPKSGVRRGKDVVRALKGIAYRAPARRGSRGQKKKNLGTPDDNARRVILRNPRTEPVRKKVPKKPEERGELGKKKGNSYQTT